MKKIMFLFLMVMGLMSSLYALDTGQIECDIEKSQFNSGADSKAISATTSEPIFAKVNIFHRDSLMYSWGECEENIKLNTLVMNEWPPTLNPETIAVVCYPRGAVGA